MDLTQILLLPLSQFFAATTAAYVLCALGIALHFGYTGLLNFGQAAFAAVGGYAFAIADKYLGFGLFGSLLFAIACAVVYAFILGIPTLRLRADYLAIVTIAAAETFRFVMISGQLGSWSGGSEGIDAWGKDFYDLNPIPSAVYNVFGIPLTERQLWADIVGWAVVVVCAVLMVVLTRSPWGRALKGIREDEDAVRSLGKNVFAYKMQSLVLGGVIGSLGGMVFVMASQTNQPSTWVSNFTFMTWTVLLLGGAATILGPVVGSAVFFMFLMLTQGVLEGLVNIGALPFLSIAQVGQIRYLLVGLFLMLLVIFRPQGFFGNKKEMQFNG